MRQRRALAGGGAPSKALTPITLNHSPPEGEFANATSVGGGGSQSVAHNQPALGNLNCLVIACGALAAELRQVKALNAWHGMDIKCLPAALHNRPAEIPPRLAKLLAEAKAQGAWDQIFVAYADCGTNGKIDEVCREAGATRLPGADCYHLFAGEAYLQALEQTPGTFFLTDFLARHFQRLVVKTYRLDERPENIQALFGNYERLIYLAQTDNEALRQQAADAAAFLGLKFEVQRTGLGRLQAALQGAFPKALIASSTGHGSPAPASRPQDRPPAARIAKSTGKGGAASASRLRDSLPDTLIARA